MNLPNKLTILRIILTPVFLACLLIPFPHHMIVAAVIFVVASVTDAIDGNYARKHNLVTDFGKFLDPLADKMLTTSAFLGFIALDIGTGITVIAFIVLFREFLISSLRLTAVSSGGTVIAANIWGKLKTVFQMIAIITAMVFEYFKYLDTAYLHIFSTPSNPSTGVVFINSAFYFTLDLIVDILLWVSTILAIISGVIYLIQNKKCIDTSK